MKTFLEFHSDKFPQSEEQEISPGVYGQRVAEFLAAGLRSEGFETEELIAQKLGWALRIKNDNFPLWVKCANYQSHPDVFICFIEPHTPVIRKLFRKIDARPRIGALHQAMDTVFSASAGARDKRWWTEEELNRPRSPVSDR